MAEQLVRSVRSGRPRTLPGHLLRELGLGRWPRVEMAAKAALSATIAWQLALWLPFAPADEYPYYAPLGAVVATYPSIASSVQESLRSVFAIIAGAVLATTVTALSPPGLVLIPVVVGGGILIAGLPLFGDMRSWVTTVALFVLVIGAQDPVNYVLAYTGLTLMGAAIAIVVTMLLPTVPMAQTTRALQALATTLADQLDDLAAALESDQPPTDEQWRERSQAIAPVLATVRASGQDVRQSLRANSRARRERGVVDRQRSEALVLDAVATRVEDLTDLLLDVRGADTRRVSLEVDLREPTAQVLRDIAVAVRPLTEASHPDEGDVRRVRGGVEHLSTLVATSEFAGARDEQAAGAVATALRRCLGALEPAGEDDVERPG